MSRKARCGIAAILSLLIAALSPGHEAYAAAFRSTPRPGARIAPPSIQAPLSGLLNVPGAPSVASLAAAPTILPSGPLAQPSVASAEPAPAASALERAAILSAALPEGSAPERGASDAGRSFDGHSLDAFGDHGAAEPPGPDLGVQTPPPPRQSLARAARVGFNSAVLGVAITQTVTFAAPALGYEFNSSYSNGRSIQLDLRTILVMMVASTVMAPIAEEVIFRGGLMGWIRSKTQRLPVAGDFLIPAFLSSAVFVVVHEWSDPVLIGVRLAYAMILSYVFHKEGYAGAIFSHAFFNGLVLSVGVASLFPPAVGGALILAAIPVLAALALTFRRQNVSERAEKKSGRLQPYEITEATSRLFMIVLALGFFFLMPNAVWIYGALGWMAYQARRFRASYGSTSLPA